MDLISMLADYAAAGAFVGGALALALRREKKAPRWMVRGTVGGGLAGLGWAVIGALS